MSKKAFIFYAAVTPAGARMSLYRETLGTTPSKVLSNPDYDTDEVELTDYVVTVSSECTFLPVIWESVDVKPIEDAIALVFANPVVGLKSSIKGSIHEVWNEVSEQFDTVLKLVSKVNGERSVTQVILNPASEG